METEIIKPKKMFFVDIPLHDSFLCFGDVHIKTSETNALNLSNRISYSFYAKDEVTPCEIQKIIIKLC